MLGRKREDQAAKGGRGGGAAAKKRKWKEESSDDDDEDAGCVTVEEMEAWKAKMDEEEKQEERERQRKEQEAKDEAERQEKEYRKRRDEEERERREEEERIEREDRERQEKRRAEQMAKRQWDKGAEEDSVAAATPAAPGRTPLTALLQAQAAGASIAASLRAVQPPVSAMEGSADDAAGIASDCITAHMQIPAARVKDLLGVQGRNVKTIKQKTGVVKLGVMDRNDPANIEIVGVPSAVEHCRTMIQAISDGDQSVIGNVSETMDIDPRLVSKLIGPKGQNILGMKDQSGAYLAVREPEGPGIPQKVVITGFPECVAKARELVARFLEVNGISGPVASAPPPQPPPPIQRPPMAAKPEAPYGWAAPKGSWEKGWGGDDYSHGGKGANDKGGKGKDYWTGPASEPNRGWDGYSGNGAEHTSRYSSDSQPREAQSRYVETGGKGDHGHEDFVDHRIPGMGWRASGGEHGGHDGKGHDPYSGHSKGSESYASYGKGNEDYGRLGRGGEHLGSYGKGSDHYGSYGKGAVSHSSYGRGDEASSGMLGDSYGSHGRSVSNPVSYFREHYGNHGESQDFAARHSQGGDDYRRYGKGGDGYGSPGRGGDDYHHGAGKDGYDSSYGHDIQRDMREWCEASYGNRDFGRGSAAGSHHREDVAERGRETGSHSSYRRGTAVERYGHSYESPAGKSGWDGKGGDASSDHRAFAGSGCSSEYRAPQPASFGRTEAYRDQEAGWEAYYRHLAGNGVAASSRGYAENYRAPESDWRDEVHNSNHSGRGAPQQVQHGNWNDEPSYGRQEVAGAAYGSSYTAHADHGAGREASYGSGASAYARRRIGSAADQRGPAPESARSNDFAYSNRGAAGSDYTSDYRAPEHGHGSEAAYGGHARPESGYAAGYSQAGLGPGGYGEPSSDGHWDPAQSYEF